MNMLTPQRPSHRRPAAARPPHRGERGQSIIVIALGMIGLLAFVGLTVDVGALYIGVGHLRRAVDAAAFAAASQFREGRTYDELEAAARQVISLNGVEPDTMELRACVDASGSASPFHDQTMCPSPGGLSRKLIKISATSRVRFSFLALVGWFDTQIQAQATSEAASVDVVLVLDTSDSMTQDATDPTMKDPAVCNLYDANRDDAALGGDGMPGECHPFEEVKSAAVNFVNRLYLPYDRISIVTFDIVPTLQVPITNTLIGSDITTLISNLQVSARRQPGLTPECTFNVDGDPGGCTNTSIGGGLQSAGNEFGRHPVRVESVWVVILLTDGAANASVFSSATGDINLYCPDTTWVQPFCRDADSTTRHSQLNTVKINPNNVWDTTHYDADDYAHDMADFVACAPKLADADGYCSDSLNYGAGEGGQGALIYAIGLGRLVVNFSFGPADAGDSTLRYIAAVGDDGDATTDPCLGVSVPSPLTAGNDSYNCGNYYFSEFGTGLTAVFDSIASRLFTRLTQ
jgi:hypothetical protein